jgi:acyl-CoA synthetase (AMP-forming)/AMP-acid ligase II/lysophospholipase L1-like esterase
MKIISFGDSLTACGGDDGRYSDILRDRFPDHQFVNRGVNGDTLKDARKRLKRDVLAEQPDAVLIEFGANDWWRGERPVKKWAGDLEALVLDIQAIGAKVGILGVFGPCLDAHGSQRPKSDGTDERGVAFQRAEAEIAERLGCLYVANIQARIEGDRHCWADANHPNEYGNRHVADAVAPIIEAWTGEAQCALRRPALLTLADIWHEAVELGASRTAVVGDGQRMTYREAGGEVERLAAGLVEVAGTDRPTVTVFLPNCLDYFLIYWATMQLGGVIVPLNTWLKPDSMTALLAGCSPDVLIAGGPGASDLIRLAEASDVVAVHVDDLHALRRDAPVPANAACDSDDAIIMYTSGTTSAPKGAVMRHSDLLFNIMTTINAHQFSPQDVHIVVNPMFHCTALYSSLPTAAYQKSTVVITADTQAEGLLTLIEEERATTLLTVPSICQRLTVDPKRPMHDLTSLRLIGYAGSPMSVSGVRALQASFPGGALHNFFGLTETISMTHVLDTEAVSEHPDSIGRLLPFVEAIIVEDGAVVGPGNVGELLFARDNVISRYVANPQRLDAAIREVGGRQWFGTGDLASFDEEGFFYIRGRKKDMIIVGGENVYANEVESVICELDAVREAAVIGVPATGVRESLGELIKAVVVTSDELTVHDIRRHCHRRLPSYKIPHLVVFLDALPRTASGKVLKDRLKARD